MCLSIAVHSPDRVLGRGEHHGFGWIVTHNGIGYRCGYVRCPAGHPWHGKESDDIDALVHYGLDFAAPDEPCDGEGPDDAYWVGFSCCHAFDAPDPALMPPLLARFFAPPPYPEDHVWTQAEVEAECRSLCEQAAAAARPPPRKPKGNLVDDARETIRDLDDRELAALALTNAWRMGLRDEVLRFLRRADPLVAAYLAMAILGVLTMDHGQAAGLEFIEAVGAAAASPPPDDGPGGTPP